MTSLIKTINDKRNAVGFATATTLYIGLNALIDLQSEAEKVAKQHPYFSADRSRFMGLTIRVVADDDKHCEVR